MDEAEGLSEVMLEPCPNPWCAARTPPIPARFPSGWRVQCVCGVVTPANATEAAAIAAWNARAESRSTPDREELKDWCGRTVEVAERVKAELGSPSCQVIQTEEDRARLVAYRYGYQVGIAEAARDVQAILARPASSAGALHVANEWADMATSGLQWLKNVRDGIATPEDAIANMLDCLKHCEEVRDALTSKGADRG